MCIKVNCNPTGSSIQFTNAGLEYWRKINEDKNKQAAAKQLLIFCNLNGSCQFKAFLEIQCLFCLLMSCITFYYLCYWMHTTSSYSTRNICIFRFLIWGSLSFNWSSSCVMSPSPEGKNIFPPSLGFPQ